MITSMYEDTYVSVKQARENSDIVDAVAEIIREKHELTCRQLGIMMYGNDYVNGHMARSYVSRLGQALRHLRIGGFIKDKEIDGEPVEYETEEYISKGGPRRIKVHDDAGNEYEIDNPNYQWHYGAWVKVKKTIIPKIKVWYWVGD